jgi:hypothetical protein
MTPAEAATRELAIFFHGGTDHWLQFSADIMGRFEFGAERIVSAYQQAEREQPSNGVRCPVCGGSGAVAYPPGQPLDKSWTSSNAQPSWPCKPCNGTGVYHAPQQPSSEPSDSERLLRTAEALIGPLEIALEHLKGFVQFGFAHGIKYTGPVIQPEIEELRTAIAAMRGKEEA